MTAAFETFFAEIDAALGADAVNRSEETLLPLRREHHARRRPAAGRRRLSGVDRRRADDRAQRPTSTACRSIRSAPATISGSAAAPRRSAGQVVVDLGHRMNRILEIDERLGFAVVEPGVSYQAMYDELVRRGNKLMLDVTSGPPQGGMIGNALDKGAGYTPYFDHFGFSCGMEIVLGNGEVLRTGDGALDHDRAGELAHVEIQLRPDPRRPVHAIELRHRHPHGHLAAAAAAGGALVPFRLSRRRRSRGDHRALPAAEDVEFRAVAVPGRQRSLSVRLGGREPGIPRERRQDSRSPTRDAARCSRSTASAPGRVSGAFYGPSAAAHRAADPARARSFRARSGKARYIAHEEAAKIPPLQVAINAFSGIPSLGELGLLKWRPGGGNTWFLPGTPMDGKIANEFQTHLPRIYEDHGLDYTVMNVCGPRFARGLHVITFNREDADERARADACYRKMSRGGRQARRVRRPRAARLSRLAHGADHAGLPAGLRGHQESARPERRDRSRPLRDQLSGVTGSR